MQAVIPQAPAPAPAPVDASLLGPPPPCNLGTDKMKQHQHFETWLEEVENRMRYMGVTEDTKKISLLRSWGGPDLVKLMKAHAGVRFDDTPATADTEAIPADTYANAVKKIKDELGKLINRTLAMHQLMTCKQGDRKWMDFIKDLEERVAVLDFDSNPYKNADAVRDAAIFGTSDSGLKEKGMAESPDLATLTRLGQSRETGKEGAQQLQHQSSSVSRVKAKSNQDNKPAGSDMSLEDIEETINQLQVMKIRKQGKFSGKPNRPTSEGGKQSCLNCSSSHAKGRCPAKGKSCFDCGGHNHFSNSQACPKSTQNDQTPPQHNVNRIDTPQSYSATTMQWPGVQSSVTHDVKLITSVNKLDTVNNISTSKNVNVTIGGVPMSLYTDTGSFYTIVPPSAYTPAMGPVVAADTHLRSWGSKENLDVKGMVKSTIATQKGAKRETKIYIVDGFHPEPLLGDGDAESLGFISFNKEGRDPSPEEIDDVKRIAQKLRDSLNITVETSGEMIEAIPPEERRKVEQLIDRYTGLVFSDDKIGRIKIDPIHLDFDEQFHPNQPSFHNVPIHYRPQVSAHLQFLREQGAITDVDPSDTHECVMNTVITDKVNGDIRMNIDCTPLNPFMKRTKFHVQTPQEIRHELKEAEVFTEVDMGWAFHQLSIDEDTKRRSIFQTHEGLHRMEVLYFGPTASSGIFHNEIRKILQGLNGVISIHDNILI